MQNIDQQLVEDLSKFYHDPLGFVMYAFPWDVDRSLQLVKLKEPWKSRFNSEYGPDTWACEFLDTLGQESKNRQFDGSSAVPPIRMAVVSGHGVGKSALTGWLVSWIMSTRPFCQGTVTANTYTQLDTKTWAQIQKWMKRCVTQSWFKFSMFKVAHKDYANEWFCSAQSCREENSEAFAGQHAANSTSFYINDEGSAIPDAIFQVQEGGLTDGEPMQFIFGNPTKNTGFFRECWRKRRHRWITQRVDSRDVQLTNKDHLETLVEDYGLDSDTVKVRVLGQFPSASSKQFISESLVDPAFGKHLRPHEHDFAPYIIGVDPAWTGEDSFVIVGRQGLFSEILGVWEKNDDDIHMAGVIARLEREKRARAVFVDGGFGTGIVSAGLTMGRNWQLIWFSGKSPDIGCLNMRAYMWLQVKKWLKDGGALPPDDRLREELLSVEIVARMDGKLLLESKEDLRKRDMDSPDRVDALALTFAMPVYSQEEIRRTSSTPVEHDFDPYEL